MKINFAAIFFMLFLAISIVYSNTIDSPWQFDDRANIIDNYAIHIDRLTPEAIWKASFSNNGHYNYRPFPNLSFGINWYLGGANTVGYHIVNILIHVITAFFLFLSCLAIFETPNLRNKFDKKDAFFISLLATVLWALNPVQTQAVTYIVQRMTCMAGMFYIFAIFFYIRGRNTVFCRNNNLSEITERKCHFDISCGEIKTTGRKPFFYYCLCIISFFCAVFSKENAAILPLPIFLIEVLFFRDMAKKVINWKFFAIIFSIITGVAIIGTLVFEKGNFLFFIERYNHRPFSVWERLLTEPRIVLNYLSQIFYPLSERFSVTHDVTVSKNLFHPWTTLPSILAVFVIPVAGVFQAAKRPILALSIIFFFLNHIIESSIIPLELVFEHRNYIPSMFLFLPVAWFINFCIKQFMDKSRPIYGLILIIVPVLIMWFGMNTYYRNNVWKTEIALWYDALKKAPGDLRPANNVATFLAWKDGATSKDLDTAITVLEHALSLNNSIRKDVYREIYGNIGNIYHKKNMFEKSVEFHKKSLEIDPDFVKGRFDLVKPLIMSERWDEASKEMDLLLNNRKGYLKSDYFNVKGLILLWQNRPDEALPYLRQALRMSPQDPSVYLNIGRALSMAGHYKNAEWFLSRLGRKEPANMFAAFCLIENSVKSGNMTAAEKYAEKMLGNNSIVSINSILKALPAFYQTVPVSADIIKPVIMQKILKLSGTKDYKQ